MFRSIIILFLVAFVVSISAGSISAVGNESKKSEIQAMLEEKRQARDVKRAEILEKIDAKKLEIQGLRENIAAKKLEIRERQASKQAELKEKAIDRIKSIFTKILMRLNAALVRLDRVADRIASRIDKLQARGVDTSLAEAALLGAEPLGAAAQVAIDNAALEIEGIDSANTSVRDAANAARVVVRNAKDALKAYHKGLVAAIIELRANVKADTEATGEADVEATEEAETE